MVRRVVWLVYVVAWTAENGGTYRLHALDLTNGNPVAPAQVIQGSAPGPNGTVHFDPSSRSSGRPCWR